MGANRVSIKNKLIIIVGSVAGGLVVFFSGCGAEQSFNQNSTLNTFCTQAVIPPVAPLKPMPQLWSGPFSQSKVKISSKPGAQISAGSSYVFILDSSCLESAPEESLSKQVFLESGKELNETKLAIPHTFKESIAVDEFEAKVSSDGCIVGVAADGKVQKASFNDPSNGMQKYLVNLNFEVGYQTFFLSKYATKSRVKVAVVDTGVDCAHPDLKCWKDSPATGFPDVVDNDHDASDADGHGTNVAGILAAITNNGVGVTGLTGNAVDLLAVRVIGVDGGKISDVYAGVQYAINSKVDVINMSFGATGDQPLLEQAVSDAVSAGIVVVMAAGNDSKKFGDAGYKYEPGFIGDVVQGGITVGSVDLSGAYSYFANFHPTKVEIAAYGNENSNDGIYSTWKGGGYQREKGTSQATPQVGAAAALLISFYKSNNISYTPASIEADLLSATTQDSQLSTLVSGGRILDFAVLSQVALGKLGKTSGEIQQAICQK